MIKELVHDPLFLGIKSKDATKDDFLVGRDLLDTLMAHRETCVGMAANMIGVRKKIIIVSMGMAAIVMYNPRLLKKDMPYEAEEGCLSLTGTRKTVRYRSIEVEYLDGSWKKHRQIFTGQIAQIIQHEVDHLYGVVI